MEWKHILTQNCSVEQQKSALPEGCMVLPIAISQGDYDGLAVSLLQCNMHQLERNAGQSWKVGGGGSENKVVSGNLWNQVWKVLELARQLLK